MNKEEITAKAQELTIKNVTDGKSKYYSCGVYKGCVVGLEYNNKQIADLEKENAKLKETIIKMNNVITGTFSNLTKAKEIMNIAIEGIKHWGIVGGTERPFEKQAEKLFNLFLDKAEQFLSEVEK